MRDIAGIIYPSAFAVTNLIEVMSQAFWHPEKPAPFDFFRERNLELGSWGASVVSNERKTLLALLDGTIYNADALKEELKDQGYTFKSNLPHEVLIHGYDAWEEKLLARLEGPFALCIYDEGKQSLLLARDRLGQKSLYWSGQQNHFLFSTQIKALMTTGLVAQTPSLEALASYLYFGFAPQDITLIEGVAKILPGHYLKVDLNQKSTIGQYWSLSQSFGKQDSYSPQEAQDLFSSRFEHSVRGCLPGERVCTLLRGTAGSAATANLLTHIAPLNSLRSYNSYFEESDPIDFKRSQLIAQELNIEHETQGISSDQALKELVRIIWALDEPVADPSIMAIWQLGKLSSSFSPFLFADLGWKQMLAGSERYFRFAAGDVKPRTTFASRLASLGGLRDRVLLPILHALRVGFRMDVLRNIDLNPAQVAYVRYTALFNEKHLKRAAPSLHRYFNPEVFSQRFHRLSSLPGKINPSLYFDAKTHLPDRFLFQYERLLSYQGIELLCPYLDTQLVELLAKMPEEVKFGQDTPAYILKQMLAAQAPNCPIFDEREGSFIESWRKDSSFKKLFALLQNGRLADEGIISGRWVKKQLSYPYLIERNFRQLFSLLVLEIWFRLNISRPIGIQSVDLSVEELFSE